MKKYFFIMMLISGLTACNKTENVQPTPKTTSASNAAAPPASAPGSLQTAIRADYQRQCVIDALGGKAADTNAQHDFAYNMCDCVYEQGIKAFGNQDAWENQIKQFLPHQPDSKIKEVSDKAIQICLQRHHPNRAAASAPN